MSKRRFPSRPYPEAAQDHIEFPLAAMLGDSTSSWQWHWRSIVSSAGEYSACVASVDTVRYSMKLYFSKKQMIEAQKRYLTPALCASLNMLRVN
jgi:hypothetical protein